MTYAKNAWYVAGCDRDLEKGKPVQIMALGESIVLYRTGSDRIVALEDRCVHRLAPLSLGRCEGEKIRCMYHGLLFEPDGRCVEIPGQELIPNKARVRAYPIVVRQSWVWIWMGDPARADEGLIPSPIGYEQEADWHVDHGWVDYAAEAELVNNNLLDLSHIPFIHAASFGVGDNYAEERPVTTQIDGGLRLDRWTIDTTGSALGRADDLVDHFVTYDFLIPGILLMWTGYFAAGTARALDFGRPDPARAIGGVNNTSHAVTPTTKGHCRFHFLSGVWKAHADRAGLDMMVQIQKMAFDEDRVIIEAQQKIIDITPDVQVMPTAHDFSVTLFNRAVERLAQENDGSVERAA